MRKRFRLSLDKCYKIYIYYTASIDLVIMGDWHECISQEMLSFFFNRDWQQSRANGIIKQIDRRQFSSVIPPGPFIYLTFHKSNNVPFLLFLLTGSIIKINSLKSYNIRLINFCLRVARSWYYLFLFRNAKQDFWLVIKTKIIKIFKQNWNIYNIM